MLHIVQPDNADHRTVIKAFRILRILGQEEHPLGVVEIARRLDLHKSSVSRLLATLERHGFVSRDRITERFVVGLALVTLVGDALRRSDLRRIAREVLERLQAATMETVNLAIPVAGGPINIDKIASQHYIRDIGWIGRQAPFHCTATGKALVAWHTPAERKALIRSPLARHTPKTICNWPDLEREFAKIRSRGYALGLEELEPGLVAVAAPIRDYERKVVASVSVSGPSMRINNTNLPRYGQAVVEAAAEISERLRRTVAIR